MRIIEIEIDEKFLELCGTGTLMGNLLSRYPEAIPEGVEIHLVFLQTSLGYRRVHGGPQVYLIPEYTVWCFTDDLVRLQEMGYKVVIKKREVLS